MKLLSIRAAALACRVSRDTVRLWVAVRELGLKTRQGDGLTDFRFHDIRHLSAMHLEEAGATPRDIQAHLGHANYSTTERYLSGHRRVAARLRKAE